VLGSLLAQDIPDTVRAHVRFSSIDGQHLRYLADSSAWSTKLRLISTTLIAAAHRHGYNGITALTIQIRRA
jgi:hypothetical protein